MSLIFRAYVSSIPAFAGNPYKYIQVSSPMTIAVRRFGPFGSKSLSRYVPVWTRMLFWASVSLYGVHIAAPLWTDSEVKSGIGVRDLSPSEGWGWEWEETAGGNSFLKIFPDNPRMREKCHHEPPPFCCELSTMTDAIKYLGGSCQRECKLWRYFPCTNMRVCLHNYFHCKHAFLVE